MRYVIELHKTSCKKTIYREEVSRMLEELLNKNEEKAKILFVNGGDDNEGSFLIITSTDMIEDVMPFIGAVAIKYGFSIYDRERDEYFRIYDCFDPITPTMIERAKEINAIIRNCDQFIYRKKVKLLEKDCHTHTMSFVISLIKEKGASFIERMRKYQSAIQAELTEDEILEFEDGCFIVKNDNYCIKYCFEGYKKQADVMCNYEKGDFTLVVPHRMSCIQALKKADTLDDVSRKDIWSRMSFREMKSAYPNPADRFVKSVNITKELKQLPFSIRYSVSKHYGAEIIFYVEDDWCDPHSLSTLKIEESCASFILPMISKYYPYIGCRYDLERNPLPWQMWEDIIEEIEKVRNMILEDTYNRYLYKYIKQFNLFVLVNDDVESIESEYERIREKPIDILYEHRFEVARMYNIFIDWLTTQAEYDDCCLINVMGP